MVQELGLLLLHSLLGMLQLGCFPEVQCCQGLSSLPGFLSLPYHLLEAGLHVTSVAHADGAV